MYEDKKKVALDYNSDRKNKYTTLFESSSRIAKNLISRQINKSLSTNSGSIINSSDEYNNSNHNIGFKNVNVSNKFIDNINNNIVENNGFNYSENVLIVTNNNNNPVKNSILDSKKILNIKDIYPSKIVLNNEIGDTSSFDNPFRDNKKFTNCANYIMNQTGIISNKEYIVRNLVHDYTKNIESNEKTYNILREKKAKRREIHLDNLEEYESWKNSYIINLKNKLISNSDSCENQIISTKNDFISKLKLSNNELLTKVHKDIKNIQKDLEATIKKRSNFIGKSYDSSKSLIEEGVWSVKHYIRNLEIKLLDNGYMLAEEIKDITKKLEESCLLLIKKHEEQLLEIRFNKIYKLETAVSDELNLNFKVFEKKWKNVNFNYLLNELENNLLSKDIVDNDLLYDKVSFLKNTQILYYKKRLDIINNDLAAINLAELNQKNIEIIANKLEDIYNEAQNKYDIHTQELIDYRSFIDNKTQKYLNNFYDKLDKINYCFGSSNSDNSLNDNEIKFNYEEEISIINKKYTPYTLNEYYKSDESMLNIISIIEYNKSINNNKKAKKKNLTKKEENEYNDKLALFEEYKKSLETDKFKKIEEINTIKNSSKTIELFIDCKPYIKFYNYNSIDEILKSNINNIIEKQKNDRTEFCTNLLNYLEEFEEYTNNICNRIVKDFYLKLAKSNDEHVKNLHKEETHFLIDIAKAEDEDEENNFKVEEELKLMIKDIQESVHKEDLDDCLDKCLKKIDYIELIYREFFNKANTILYSHEDRLLKVFSDWETNILKTFGILTTNNINTIKRNRLYESEFLSRLKLKYEELEQLKEANSTNKNNNKSNKNIKNLKNDKLKNKNNNKTLDYVVPARTIDNFTSLMGFDYHINSSINEIVNLMYNNIIHSRNDEILDLIDKKPEITNENNVPTSSDINITVSSKLISNKNNNNKSNNKEKAQKGNKKTSEEDDLEVFLDEDFDIINAYNPFQKANEKVFSSPLMLNGNKALYDDNELDINFIINLVNNCKNNILIKIKEDFECLKDQSKNIDNERREDYLSDLDIKIKSIAPRKGKIQVEEYDVKLSLIEKHKNKFAAFKKNILDRNNKELINNENIVKEIINPLYEEYKSSYDNILSSLKNYNESNIKGLSDIYKKFKTNYNEINAVIEENKQNLNNHVIENPRNLINLCKNYIVTLTNIDNSNNNKIRNTIINYSKNEVIYYTELVNDIIDNNILKQMDFLKNENENRLNSIVDKLKENSNNIDNLYNNKLEYLLALNSTGSIFGQPKSIINQCLIDIKMKINQGFDFINSLFIQIKETIDLHNIKDFNYIELK